MNLETFAKWVNDMNYGDVVEILRTKGGNICIKTDSIEKETGERIFVMAGTFENALDGFF